MHWTLENILWISSFILELSLAAALLYGRFWRPYPCFCTYAFSEVMRTGVLLMIGNGPRHYATYFYTYWISEAIVSLIGFAVIGEVFRDAFSAKLGLQNWGIILFRSCLVGLLIIGLLTAHGSSSSDVKLIASIFLLKRVESFVRLGLIVALFAFVFVLGLTWTRPIMGIAAGFAIYGAVEVAAIGVRSGYGHIAARPFGLALMIANICQKTLWIAYFFRPDRSLPLPPATRLTDPEAELERMHDAARILVER